MVLVMVAALKFDFSMNFNIRDLIQLCVDGMNNDKKLEASKLLGLIFLLKAVQPIAPAQVKNNYSQLRSHLGAEVAAGSSFFE